MNGKNMLIGLSYIDRKFIEESENDTVSGKSGTDTKKAPRVRTLRRPLLIAALIALMLLLVGCAVVYMLSLKEIKLGEQQTSYDSFSYDPDTGIPIEYLGRPMSCCK